LKNLIAAWVKRKAILEKILADATLAYNTKVKECNALEA